MGGGDKISPPASCLLSFWESSDLAAGCQDCVTNESQQIKGDSFSNPGDT